MNSKTKKVIRNISNKTVAKSLK